MDKMSAIMTTAPEKLMQLEKEFMPKEGEDEQPMYKTIGKIAKLFMEQISKGIA